MADRETHSDCFSMVIGIDENIGTYIGGQGILIDAAIQLSSVADIGRALRLQIKKL